MEEQMTVISTSNLAKEDVSWLIDQINDHESALVVFPLGEGNGFLVPLNEEMLKERERFPVSFETAVVYAMARKSEWLMIDPIAKEAPLLREYQW